MDTKLYFEKWSEKLSIPIEDIQTEYDALVTNEKEIHKDLSEEDQETQALKRLAMLYKKQLRSPAIGFEGMVIGVGDLFDTVRKMREAGMDAFRVNPHQAIEQGITDSDGNPLDTREVFGTGRQNIGFGKPLPEHSYIRNIVGIALRSNVEEGPKTFSMTLNGDKAENLIIELFKPVKFRAINKSDEGDASFVLNGSSITTFEVSDKIKMPAPIDVLRKVCGNMFVPLAKIQEYHTSNKDDFNRLGLFEGDVSILGTEPTSTGNRMMVIEDMEASMVDIGIPGMTCWIPKGVVPDFGEGSKVIVVGRTAQGKSRDDPNALGDVMLNVLGIYVIPEFKIEAPEPVTDDNIDEAIEKAQENLDAKVNTDLGNAPIPEDPTKAAESIGAPKEVQTELPEEKPLSPVAANEKAADGAPTSGW